ncbi:MAG: carbon monoxide dehydrogenase [Rhodospirillaceae bacterium]|nr:MAG: carbon monoxide dehydrogenase [Rhodospirillaceae bacterium]
MEMTGEYLIAAPRPAVWAALNDLNILKAAIPGCQSMAALPDNQIEAVVTATVGPVKATFKGVVTLSDLDPPNGYTIRGEGKGGVAGFARGGAVVRLADAPGGTLLSYKVDAAVGGKLAQIGSRLIDSTAKKLADEFFAKFGAEAAGRSAAPSVTVAPQAAAPTPSQAAVTPQAASATVKADGAISRDALADFKPIGFGTWMAVLVALAALVGIILVVW